MLWNPFTGKALGQLVGHGASVLELRMNEDDHQLISLAADKTVKVWDIRTYKCLQVRWRLSVDPVFAFCFLAACLVTRSTRLVDTSADHCRYHGVLA
jgi:WD40 repeat protein